jgi:tRNA A-37 threonylcarbamoyl transferase component Bud32/tetratricopeptide (TPR) repeat protein
VPDFKSRLDAALSHRYQLERELGRGEMATVWLARDLKHGRRVALKVLHPELAATLGPERFLREIQIAASLTHPNILPLHESGEAGGYLYYVMPHVEGESLRDRLRREIQLPIEDAIRIAREVADALGYAHGRGLIHRDIKPENILLEAGHAVVADFGVARAIESAGGDLLTATGLVVGTPAYMSPEQAGGSDRLDGRSDLYSLGCVLYEMLAGEPPFSARTPQALAAKHLNATPPGVRVTRATVPPGVARVIERALAKVPADRYADAGQFAVALGLVPVATGEDVAVEPKARGGAGGGYRAVLGVLLVGALVAAGWRLSRPGRPALDPSRVVVFPLRDVGATGPVVRDGEAVATYIGYSLEGSQPLRWLDGWDRLSEREREGLVPLSSESAARISQAESARYYIDGSIVRGSDSVAVILRLHDVEADSLVKRAGSTAPNGAVGLPQLGLLAVSQLLPSLVGRGRAIDLSAFSDRKPAAIALFLQGMSEYRRMRFKRALPLFQRAAESDSLFGVAAAQAAITASWLEQHDVAKHWAQLALERGGELSSRYTGLARGLRHFLNGTADSATHEFRALIDRDSTWAEAWTALGETYHHLLPTEGPTDSLAQAAFQRASVLDADFSPPLLHLAQSAIRRGNVAVAERLLDQAGLGESEVWYRTRLTVEMRCVRDGPGSVEWSALKGDPETLLAIGRDLSAGGYQARCAGAALAAAFEADSASSSTRWGALLGLQGHLAAEGRYAELQKLLESEAALRVGGAVLYLVLAAAGHPLRDAAASVANRFGDEYASWSTPNLWALGQWESSQGDTARLGRIVAAMDERADSTKTRRDVLIARALRLHLVLLRGDSATAMAGLAALATNAPLADLEWQPWEALGPEKLLLAKLLLAGRRFADGLSVAAQFDSPQPVIYSVYLPASLSLRIRAAEGLQGRAAAAELRERLAMLRPNEVAIHSTTGGDYGKPGVGLQ